MEEGGGGRSSLITGMWKRGEAGSHFKSPDWEGGSKGGRNRRSNLDYQDYREKLDHTHMVSDRASNYFVTGEDDIKPGSIPGIQIGIVESMSTSHTHYPHHECAYESS